MAQREEAVGMAEFVTPRLAIKKPSPPDLPVTYYSSSASINGGFSAEILQHYELAKHRYRWSRT